VADAWGTPRARIGARTVLHAHVSIGADSRLGDDFLVHAQTSIG
jgi:UDP-3-O-[3-hydroxymyristoyl] glucosamine N-acyltransferase